MGKIIAVVSGKGGTGKHPYRLRGAVTGRYGGYETLALDCDITLRNLDLALGLSDSAAMDFSDVLDGRCTLAEATVPHRKYPKLSLLAAPRAPRDERFSVPAMQALARDIRQRYDYCLVDAPPDWGRASRWPQPWPTAWWWLPPPTPPHCGTPSAPRYRAAGLPAGTGASGGEPGTQKNAEGPSFHHRRRHGHGGPSPAGRHPEDGDIPPGPEPGHPPYGT